MSDDERDGRVALPEIRELLFADLAPGRLVEVLTSSTDGDTGPGGARTAALIAAATAAARGDRMATMGAVTPFLEDPETRIRLQAWRIARAVGYDPPVATAARAHGVVVEMGLDDGVDSIAAYEDGTARYLNHGGAAIVWEAQEPEVNARIEAMLHAARIVAEQTGPADGTPARPPGPGVASIAVLTDGGVHLGMGPADVFWRNPIAGPQLATALDLMRTLVDRAGSTA